MPIDESQLPPELVNQFRMFEMLVDQMTDDALRGFLAFLEEKLEARGAR